MKRIKVAFLGPEGTYSDEAGKLYAKKIEDHTKVDLYPYANFHEILHAANKGKVDEAIVPIENAHEGTIQLVSDMLVKEVDLKIRQEIVIPINHFLMALKGTTKKQITDIVSHPQPIDQCKDYLQKNFYDAKIHLAPSTSEAAKRVAAGSLYRWFGAEDDQKKHFFAAIAPKEAAKIYDLEILDKEINAKENSTRFVVLAKEDHPKTGRDKTSIVFSIMKDKPGGLFSVLKEFAERKINLTKIESRPTKTTLGHYYFFIDLEGHREDDLIFDALEAVKKSASFYKLLGSYPRAKTL
jgi:prephenate dehydratase